MNATCVVNEFSVKKFEHAENVKKHFNQILYIEIPVKEQHGSMEVMERRLMMMWETRCT